MSERAYPDGCFGVFRNTDLTECRGSEKPIALFWKEGDAQEAAIGIDVQGSNGSVRPVVIHASFDAYLETAETWERTQHLERLRKARARIDGLITKVSGEP